MRADSDSPVPDIIVSDIRMPGFSGIDVLSAIRRVDLQVPVILITGFGSAEVAAEAQQLGAASLFTKPFDLDDLRTALRYFLEHWRGEAPHAAGQPARTPRGTAPRLKH
jgi:DNA-binding NtrC family response regulator